MNKNLQALYDRLSNEEIISFRDENGNSLLHLALTAADNKLAAKILQRDPFMVNAHNNDHKTPIYAAHTMKNIDGVKLCLEYMPQQGDASNQCAAIYKEIKGTAPYYVPDNMFHFTPALSEANADKLAIVLVLPDPHYSSDNFYIQSNAYSNHFKQSNVPTLTIGNLRHSIDLEAVKTYMQGIHIPSNVMVIIDGHGAMNKAGNHIISFDNTEFQSETKMLFMGLRDIFGEQPIEVALTACHGGGALKDAHYLPTKSNLVVLSKSDATVDYSESVQPVSIPEDYTNTPEHFTSSHFLKKYMLGLKSTNNVPGIAQADGPAMFIDTETHYVGKSLTTCQKNLVVKALEAYCPANISDCKTELYKVMDLLSATNSLDTLQATSKLYLVYAEEMLLPAFMESDSREEHCRNSDEITTGAFFESLKLSSETDYQLCQQNDLPESITAACAILAPTRPHFGMAMAILHELEQIDTAQLCYTATNMMSYNMDTIELSEIFATLSLSEQHDFRDTDGNTLLHLALFHGLNAQAEAYLLAHPDALDAINILNNAQKSPIYMANLGNNLEGAKLAMEFYPNESYLHNNCTAIYHTIKGQEPYFLHKDFSHHEEGRAGEIAILIAAPDDIVQNQAIEGWLLRQGIEYIRIGDYRSSLSLDIIQKEISKYDIANKKVTIIVQAHGHLSTEDGLYDANTSTHLLEMGVNEYYIPTKDLFVTLKETIGEQPLEVFFLPCHGGAALKDADYLAPGSRLFALAKPESVVDGDAPFMLDDTSYTVDSPFSLAETLLVSYMTHLHSMNSVPGIAIAGEGYHFLDEGLLKMSLTPTDQFKLYTQLPQISTHIDYTQLTQVFSAVNQAATLADLKAPETLDNAYDQYLLEIWRSQSAETNQLEVNYHQKCGGIGSTLEPALLFNALTFIDFSICQSTWEDSVSMREEGFGNIVDACGDICPTEQPIFSTALALNYLLTTLAEPMCLAHSGLAIEHI
jgi:ankyrin repeat protein